MRPCAAPRAWRRATSRAREVARARSRFAILAHARRRTKPTAPRSTRSAVFTFPTRICWRGVTRTDQPAFTSGYSWARRAERPSISAWACARETSGLRRPMTRSQCPPRRGITAEERILGERNPDLLAFGEERHAEIRGHDADDREGTLIEVDGSSDDAGIGAKALAPERLAEDDHGSGAFVAVLGKERAPGERL